MRPIWMRLQKKCLLLSTGGVTLGILQGLELVNFASLIASLLASWLSMLVTLLLGGGIDGV